MVNRKLPSFPGIARLILQPVDNHCCSGVTARARRVRSARRRHRSRLTADSGQKAQNTSFLARTRLTPPSAGYDDDDGASERAGRVRTRRFKSGCLDQRIKRVTPGKRRELPVASPASNFACLTRHKSFKGEYRPSLVLSRLRFT